MDGQWLYYGKGQAWVVEGLVSQSTQRKLTFAHAVFDFQNSDRLRTAGYTFNLNTPGMVFTSHELQSGSYVVKASTEVLDFTGSVLPHQTVW